MRDVHVIGIGQTKVGELWDRSLRQLGAEAVRAALADAEVDAPQALFVGNMLSGEIGAQQHIATLVAEHAGLEGIAASRVEAACGSGGAALRAAYAEVASGLSDVAVVLGVEKMTDRPGPEVTAGLAGAADADYEARMGLSFVALNALLMRRYMHEHGVAHRDFAPFVANAHANGRLNPHAMFHFDVTTDDFARSSMVADPITVLDCSPVCDGAAALVIAADDVARARSSVRIRACAIGTDTVALHDRRDLLRLEGVARSAHRAFEAAGVGPADVDLFEAHDAFSIMAALSLEGCGFAEPGRAVDLAQSGAIGRDGRLPMSTRGGLKARGHPVGASGVYQVAEVVEQLRGAAGRGQVPGARLGMAQSIGGSGATAITTLLEATQ
jgi:acetyl-CoA C-acetyltransferase